MLALLTAILFLQAPVDSLDIYSDKQDSLQATVFVSRQKGNYISKLSQDRVEVVSAAGLRKMACCNLAESFENSASVSVGYSDAVTGARQIRLLGLSGTYVQMLDENRPVMRGLAAPFGLSYVPSPWLESIQIAKGAASVINGAESMTGTINMEHKKPTDEKPLFLNYSAMNDSKMDLNLVSCLQLNDDWSTAVFGHVSGNLMAMDGNGDGFADDPRQLQLNLGNRWLYYSPKGVEVRFGGRAIKDRRQGGQLFTEGGWISDIDNSGLDAFLKVGIPVGEAGSVAMVSDLNIQKMQSSFGPATSYNASQASGFVNFLYANQFNDNNKYTVGLSATLDSYNESLSRIAIPESTTLGNAGVFGEYTFSHTDAFTAIAGLRADYYLGAGVRAIPRITLKYAPSESLVFRMNAGRGLRHSTPVIDNIGVLSTNKILGGNFDHTLEECWIAGGNASWYIGGSSSNYLSLDFFHSNFVEQKIVDYADDTTISFYNLSTLENGRSFTNTIQADLSFEPAERFTVTTTFRYTDARQTLKGKGLGEKPMTSRYKGVLNLQYALPLNKWIFDFTASVNGPCRVYDFMESLGGYTPVYPLLYFQVTKRFKGFDIYAGGENLTSYRQKNVIISTPDSPDFDASCVWGPIMGAKIYAGVRITIWKI